MLLASPGIASTWEMLSSPQFYLHYQSIDRGIADTVAQQAEQIYRAISDDAGYAPPRKIAVYFCPTLECFRQKQPADVTLPEWAVGVAYPDLNRIVIRSALTLQEGGRVYPLEIFKHEVAHIVLEQALAARGGAPRWLSEGFAMYHAREWTIAGQRTIQEATLRGAFIPLTLLSEGFPADEAAARVAYAQSFSLVAFLLTDEKYGKVIFHKFIANLQTGMDTNTALLRSAGVDLRRLEVEWQKSLKTRYSWLNYLIDIGLFWFVISVVFVVVYLVKRYKSQQIEDQWEAEETEEEASKEEIEADDADISDEDEYEYDEYFDDDEE